MNDVNYNLVELERWAATATPEELLEKRKVCFYTANYKDNWQDAIAIIDKAANSRGFGFLP